jgi:copper homeostasis protein
MGEGGTTPGYGIIKSLRQELEIGVNVMIRPRGGDFFYDEREFEIMKLDIALCRQLGINGVVFGILNPDGTIDAERCNVLVELARPMSVTFHRAFDMTADLFSSMEVLVGCGVERILSSGGKNTAIEGVETLKRLVERADDRILIMPGSGINAENICKIEEYTGANEFHMSGKTLVDSKMKWRKQGISLGGIPSVDEHKLYIASEEKIKNALEALRKCR